LVENLQTLEDDIIEKNVKLIIIDSLASIVRRDFTNDYMVERASFFNKLASLLKYYASEFNLSVVAINQTIAKGGGVNIAGLGKVWSHCINTRLVFEFATENEIYQVGNSLQMPVTSQLKKLTIAKSPLSAVVTLFYSISLSGLVILKRKDDETSDMIAEEKGLNSTDGVVVEYLKHNFWEDTISANTNDPSMNTSIQHESLRNRAAF
jgi:RAD51-like protein 1